MKKLLSSRVCTRRRALWLFDKHFVDRSNTVEGHKLEKEVLLVKMKEYLEAELVMDSESMQYVC